MKISLTWLTLFSCIINIINGYRTLSQDSLKAIAQRGRPDSLDVNNGRLLKPLLVERVSGTAASVQVRNMIIQHFERLQWHIELDTFSAMTPLGEKNFTNIIVTKQPKAQHRLVLAAHYDSKYSPNFEFIGATDSAVPCAILLSLAETLNDQLGSDSDWSSGKRKRSADADLTTLELVFFDGEEAFVEWSDTDSIYGARHLAEIWETTRVGNGQRGNRLDMIDVIVLLDLMGTSNPTFHNFFPATSSLYHHLANLEKRLSGTVESWKKVDRFGQALLPMFPTESTMLTYHSNAMSDDHIPFKDRGVNILHLIPVPFPKEWHTPHDNADCLDPPSIWNLDMLFRIFVCEYLELSPASPHNEL
ncbi:hypothetical protein BC941DRAFT_369628 [Chlamydoabsidia padenii]|nr:hypothetical protein BC941DRAFT_369628 [Chlamydoabsidia padenii]